MSTPPAIEPAASPRRDFLGKVGRGLGILAGIEILAVVVAYLAPGKGGAGRGDALVVAGPVAEFTPSSVRAFPGGKFYLARLADGGFLALSSRCTHLGCTVPWDEKTKVFACPCHASSFDMYGNFLNQPVPRALDYFPVSIDNKSVVRVDTSQLQQREKFSPDQLTYAA